MLRNLSTILVIMVLALFVISCRSQQPTVQQQIETGDIPAFFLTPLVADDAFFGVGVGEPELGALSTRRTMALSRARADIARQVETQIRSAITDYAQVSGAGNNPQALAFIETITREITDTALRGATQRDAHVSADGTVYVLVEYRLDRFRETARQAFIRSEEAAFAEFKATEALNRLMHELNNNPTRSLPVTH
ncbi:MAG: LPP20 family lipoprotein [Spirochaetes bacterium]|nr:LPP20 family lipoprotein [Spirochaetota bacterium]